MHAQLKYRLALALPVLLIGLLALAPAAHAQDLTTLRIEDGAVYVNSERVPAEELPASLDVRGMQAEVRFSGAAATAVELNGHAYTVRDGALYEVPASSDSTLVFFRTRPTGDAGDFFTRQADAHREAAVLFRQQHEAMIQALQQQEYLGELRRANRQLYRQLGREAQLEAEARALAVRIRVEEMEERAEQREAQVRQLREHLERAFELKQQNRRREIGQLEEELEQMMERLEERLRLRERIIERRLQELLNAPEEE